MILSRSQKTGLKEIQDDARRYDNSLSLEVSDFTFYNGGEPGCVYASYKLKGILDGNYENETFYFCVDKFGNTHELKEKHPDLVARETLIRALNKVDLSNSGLTGI